MSGSILDLHVFASDVCDRLQITIQFFDGCPHWDVAEQRLRYQRIDSPEDAERLDFHGSPTLLVNGRDLFAGREVTVGLGCRVYKDRGGITGCAISCSAPPRFANCVLVQRSSVVSGQIN